MTTGEIEGAAPAGTLRPVLFSGVMVRALLEGRKTQTRRLAYRTQGDPSEASIWAQVRPNDRLWVRERWRVGAWRDDGRVAIDYRATPEERRTPWLRPPGDTFAALRAQSIEDAEAAIAAGVGSTRRLSDGYAWEAGDSPARWRASIHMPLWASRLTLRVTEVRQERVGQISEGDAKAEGWPIGNAEAAQDDTSPVDWFIELWDGLHGTGAFDGDPVVVVTTFVLDPRGAGASP